MDATKERRCTKCGETRPLAWFSPDKKGRDGLRAHCRTCRKAATDAWRERNREHLRAYQVQYEKRTRRASWLKTKYGITPDEYDGMLAAQGGVCAICRQPQKPFVRYMDVDHCHDANRVRGLLCRACNTAIGLLGDDPDRIRAVLRYLTAT